MQKEQVHLLVLGEPSEDIVVRHGDAQKIHDPVRLDITGQIDAPSRFLIARMGIKTPDGRTYFNPAETHLLVERSKSALTLVCREADPFGPRVRGVLMPSRDALVLGINDERAAKPPQDLAALLKRHRHLFADKETAMRVVADLQSFRGTIKTDLEQSKDNRGNRRNLVAIAVETSIPVAFDLKVPLFEGQPKVTVKVEIALNGRDAGVSCWLDSPEFLELTEAKRDEIINCEIAPFSAVNVAIIEI